MTHKNRWLLQTPLTPEADSALAAHPPLLRQILFNRGIATATEADAFLRAESNFSTDPFQMKGMRVAVDRIQIALANREPIAIYGDYDVDGVTATALLVQVLRALSGNPSTSSGQAVREYIPNRFEEGYGLNNEALTALANEGVRLVITVDCGVRSPDEARHARDLGLDLIITDHHEPSGSLPDALAVLNPKQDGDLYPEKYLAGVGIAYKIAEALILDGGRRTVDSLPSTVHGLNLNDYLDLVALGTVADLAPLTGENRALVRKGLAQMRETPRQGLYLLANVAGADLKKVNAQTIGFTLGPRLNASGRLESALASFNLLTTTDVKEAGDLSLKLNQQNLERQKLTKEIQTQAEALALDGQMDSLLLFAVHPEFNHGVVGLAASRLSETHYLPAVVGNYGEETTRCSCRSIPEFHITHALDECTDLLVRHGGHAAAAGFTVRNENLDELVARLRSIATRELGGRDLCPNLTADAEVPLSRLTFELLKQLEQLQPTGYGNPEPVFISRKVKVQSSRAVGADSKHLKLSLTDGRVTVDAIGFRLGDLLPNLPPMVDVLYTFEANEYNGRTSLQLNLKDIKPAGLPD
jgi:single-stranded-DNA-specific exonuclease